MLQFFDPASSDSRAFEDPVPPDGHPSLFRFAVLFVNEGDSYGVPEEFGGTVQADPVLAQILLRLFGKMKDMFSLTKFFR